MKPSFIKNIILRFAITLPVNFSGLIVLPLLTRLYTQDIYGAWLQIILIKGLLFNLLSLRLETALVRYLPGEKNKDQLIKSVFTVTVCCSICFIIFLYFFRDGVSHLVFGKRGLTDVLMLASLWIAVSACMQIGLETLRSQEKIVTLSVREVVSVLWLISSSALAYILKLDIQRLILICIAGDSILLIWIFTQIGISRPFISLFQSVHVIKKFVPYSVPLIFNSLFLWFTGSIDRLILANMLDLSAVGIYGVTLQVAVVLAVVLNPITFVLFPRTAAAWSVNNKDEVNQIFSQSLFLTLIFGLPALTGIFIVSKGLVALLAGSGYETGESLVFFLLLANLANAIYQNHISIIHLVEKTYFLPVLFISTAAINFFCCYFFVMKYGMLGAAVARFAAYSIMALIVTIWGRKYIKFSLPWGKVFKAVVASILMGFITSRMPTNTWMQLLAVIASGVIIYIVLVLVFRVITIPQLKIMKSQYL